MVRKDVVSYPYGDRLVADFFDFEVLQIVNAGRDKLVAAQEAAFKVEKFYRRRCTVLN